MPEFRLIDNLDIKTAEGHTSKFPNLPLIGLQIRVKATKAAVAILESMLGKVRVEHRGQEVVNCQWVNLRKYQDLLYGKPEKSENGAGNESYFGIFIPFYHPELPNAIHNEVGDNMHFYIDAISEASCTNADVGVYAVIEEVPERYIPKLYDWTETCAAGDVPVDVASPNIAAIMLTKPATTVQTKIQILVDDHLKISGDWYNLVNYTNNVSRIEATALEVILYDAVQRRRISDALSDSCKILSTGGAGAFYCFVQHLIFNATRTQRSVQRVVNRDNANVVARAQKQPEGAAIAIEDEPAQFAPATIGVVAAAQPSLAVQQQLEVVKTRVQAASEIG